MGQPVNFRLFLTLAIMQALHSTEEYIMRLYDNFPIVTGYIHEVVGFFPVINMSGGTFVLLNILAVAIMIVICLLVYTRHRLAPRAAIIASAIEVINGLLHLSAAAYTGGYFPGAVSAAGLLVFGILMIRSMKSRPVPNSG